MLASVDVSVQRDEGDFKCLIRFVVSSVFGVVAMRCCVFTPSEKLSCWRVAVSVYMLCMHESDWLVIIYEVDSGQDQGQWLLADYGPGLDLFIFHCW